MDVSFGFKLGERVMIQMVGREGLVRGLFIDRDNVKYALVEYSTVSGSIEQPWVREEDMRSREPA